MAEPTSEIPGNPRPPRRRRLLVRIVGLAGQLLLILAACTLAVLFMVLTLWWKITTWTVRQAPERQRSAVRRQALLDLVRAAGTLAATREKRGVE